MPQILVVTDSHDETGGDIVYRERLSLRDFESDHFSGQFAERVGWAVLDADLLEQKESKGPAVTTPQADRLSSLG